MSRFIKLCRDLYRDLKRRPPSRITGWHAGGRPFLVAEIVDLLMNVTRWSGFVPGSLSEGRMTTRMKNKLFAIRGIPATEDGGPWVVSGA